MCANSHVKEGNNLKVEILERQVAALKHDIEEVKKTNLEKLENERTANTKQFISLSSTVADIVERLKLTKMVQTGHTDRVTNVEESPKHGKMTSIKETEDEVHVNTSKMSDKASTSTTTNKESFKCDECNFESNKEIILNKHINTKHALKVAEKDTKYKASRNECSLCEDRFELDDDLEKHVDEHIQEIEGLDIASLTNGHDLFECNLCSFESGLGDSIREHLIDHVKPQREGEPIYKTLLDEYDDDGNYIGNNPKYMDNADEESESEPDEEEAE